MKKLSSLIRVFFFLLCIGADAGAVDPSTPVLSDQIDKVNYSYGHQLGEQLLTGDIRFNPEILWRALNHGLAESPPQLERAAMAQFLTPPIDPREIDGVNYAYGYQLGELLVVRQVEFRAYALWQGLYDALDQVHPLLSRHEMAANLDPASAPASPEFESTKGKVTPQPQGPPPKIFRLKGAQFIDENQGSEGVVSLPSGLQYKILKSGSGAQPKGTDTVLVNYRASTIEGQEFSSSSPMGIPTPQEFKVAKVVPGLSEALRMMHVGDHWEIYIPTRLAYKDAGPMAGQTVIFNLELLEILPEFR